MSYVITGKYRQTVNERVWRHKGQLVRMSASEDLIMLEAPKSILLRAILLDVGRNMEWTLEDMILNGAPGA